MGRLDVEEMLDELSWEQFCGWVACYESDPWGEERSDLRNGMLMSLYANAHRKPGTRPFKATDFTLKFDRPKRAAKKPMTREEFRSAFDGFKEMVKATAG